MSTYFIEECIFVQPVNLIFEDIFYLPCTRPDLVLLGTEVTTLTKQEYSPLCSLSIRHQAKKKKNVVNIMQRNKAESG